MTILDLWEDSIGQARNGARYRVKWVSAGHGQSTGDHIPLCIPALLSSLLYFFTSTPRSPLSSPDPTSSWGSSCLDHSSQVVNEEMVPGHLLSTPIASRSEIVFILTDAPTIHVCQIETDCLKPRAECPTPSPHCAFERKKSLILLFLTNASPIAPLLVSLFQPILPALPFTTCSNSIFTSSHYLLSTIDHGSNVFACLSTFSLGGTFESLKSNVTEEGNEVRSSPLPVQRSVV